MSRRLFLWVYGWVGIAMRVGVRRARLDVARPVHDAVRPRRRGRSAGSGVERWAPAPYPARLGAWPAVVGLTFFVWLELVYRGGGLGVVLIALHRS